MAYKSAYWIVFKDGTAGCTEGETLDIARTKAEAKTGKAMQKINKLPYPANPRLLAKEDQSDCPDFCHSPRQCVGRGACPQSYACSE